MRSVERRFRYLEGIHPTWSSYACFREAVAGRRLSRKTLGHWFHILVDKEDYAKREERGVLDDLMDHTKSAEDGSKWEKTRAQRA